MKSTNFDKLAFSYDSALTPLPTTYIDFLRRVCELKPHDRIVDLGCGSGLLTFPLKEIGCDVTGVDSSVELIRIANKRDRAKEIKWVLSRVESFAFDIDAFTAVLSFEAFHLFPAQTNLVKRCIPALHVGGTFGIGWCTFHWENVLKEAIVEVFASHGIDWGEWGYQRCDNLVDLVSRSENSLSQLAVEDLSVDETTGVTQIATYLASIDKVAALDNAQRKALALDLETSFLKVISEPYLSGETVYSLAYTKKLR